MSPATSTLKLPVTIDITAEVHEIEGGGFWAEVPRFPGCVAVAGTPEELPDNIIRAVWDWVAGEPVKTEAEAKELATVQGGDSLPDDSYPQPYPYQPPPSWSDVGSRRRNEVP